MQFVALALVVVGLFVLVFVIRRQMQQVDTVLEELSSRLGGRVVREERGWFTPAFAATRLEAQIGDVSVTLTMFLKRHGKRSQWYTRAAAPAASAHRFNVYKASLFSWLGEALGMQDATIGDDDYDRLFVIKTDDPKWLVRVLAPPVRRVHAARPELSLSHDGMQVTAVRRGLPSDARVASDQMELAAACALSIR